MKKRRKITGEKAVFERIWNERPHVCERCGRSIREAKAINFAHKERKSQRPDLRLDPANIELVCARCHVREHGGKGSEWYLPD